VRKRIGSWVLVTVLSCTTADASTLQQSSQSAISWQIKAEVASAFHAIADVEPRINHASKRTDGCGGEMNENLEQAELGAAQS